MRCSTGTSTGSAGPADVRVPVQADDPGGIPYVATVLALVVFARVARRGSETDWDERENDAVDRASQSHARDSEDDRSFRLARFKLRHAVELWKASGYPD